MLKTPIQMEQYLAMLLLFLVMVSCLIVACVDLLRGEAIPEIVQNLLSVGLGMAAHALGVQTGIKNSGSPMGTP